MLNDQNKGIVALLLASFAWGTMGVLVRWLNEEITPFTQILLRFVFACLLISVTILLKKKKFVLSNRKDYVPMIIIGVLGYGLSTVCYTLAILYTTISSAVFLLSLYVVFTPFLSVFFLKEKLTKKIIFSVFIAIAGALFIFNPTGLLQNTKGNLLGLLSGILTAIYFVGSRHLNKNNSSEVVTFYSTVCGIITLLPLAILFEKPLALSISPFSWVIVFLFAFANFSAFYLANIGFSKIKASIGGVILLMENFFATALALIFFQEIPSMATVIGAALIVSSVVYLKLGKEK